MAEWSIQSSNGSRTRVEADDWIEALQTGLPSVLGPCASTRLSADVLASGKVVIDVEDGRSELLVEPAPADTYALYDRASQGTVPILIESVPYIHASSYQLEPIFGCTNCTELDTGEVQTRDLSPVRSSASEADAPGDLDAQLHEACVRYEQQTGSLLEGALGLFGEFVHTDALGIRSEQYEVDGWLCSAGSTRSLASGARAARLRRFVRQTGTTLSFRDATRDEAAILTPLPTGSIPEHDLEQGVFESWRRGGRYHGWQQEVAMLVATVLCEQLTGHSERPAQAQVV